METPRAAEAWKGRKVVVVGLSRSGLSAANLLSGLGATVFATDSAPESKLGGGVARLRRQGVEVETGGHSEEKLTGADLLVVSPGVPLDIPLIKAARGRGLKIIGELELGYHLYGGRIMAVTGTNGKTTVVNLIARILESASIPVILAGNVGDPFCGRLSLEQPSQWAVLEVSSFQLETIERFHPQIAAVLNITPDHLDRHGDFETYRRLKARIAENQTSADWLVLNRDDPGTGGLFEQTPARLVPISLRSVPEGGMGLRSGLMINRIDEPEKVLMATYRLQLRGEFNLANCMAAAACAVLAGAGSEQVAAVLSRFTGLEHRLEFVRKVKDVSYYNDSKATNVDAAKVAMESFAERLVVILGGRDKGSDFSPLRSVLKDRAVGVILIGEASDQIAKALDDVVPCQKSYSMGDAVRTASKMARPGEVVLLSPACASYDMFDNFEQRGKAFKHEVGKIQ